MGALRRRPSCRIGDLEKPVIASAAKRPSIDNYWENWIATPAARVRNDVIRRDFEAFGCFA
jgi:hypothetical protein